MAVLQRKSCFKEAIRTHTGYSSICRNDTLFVWFRKGQTFPMVFSNNVIMTSKDKLLKLSLCILAELKQYYNCAKFHWATFNGSGSLVHYFPNLTYSFGIFVGKAITCEHLTVPAGVLACDVFCKAIL